MQKRSDRFGFQFWLGWILWFAGSLILASIFWTFLFTKIFGQIKGPELTLSWSVSVFGSWFLFLVPFMRKKEQIWKRLNQDQERAVDAWLQGMGFFIGLLILSSIFWSYWFKEKITHPSARGFDPLWAKSVFGTWLFLLMPFLVFMYRRADVIFKAAVIRQTQPVSPVFKTALVEKSKRILPPNFSEKLRITPATIHNGHIVNVTLKDGRKVPNVFVFNKQEILGVYDRLALGFENTDIANIEPVAAEQLPAYEESKWLRLDGR